MYTLNVFVGVGETILAKIEIMSIYDSKIKACNFDAVKEFTDEHLLLLHRVIKDVVEEKQLKL